MDGSESKIVNLNVGGVFYTTSIQTLLKYSESMLALMFSGDYKNTVDNNGRYFIDADGNMFKYVLNFLRRNKLFLPKEFKESQLNHLLAEAEFYQIVPLIDKIVELQATVATEMSTVVLFIHLPVVDSGELFEDAREVRSIQCKKVNSYYDDSDIRDPYDDVANQLTRHGFQTCAGIMPISSLVTCLGNLILEGYIKEESAEKIKSLRVEEYEIWWKESTKCPVIESAFSKIIRRNEMELVT